MSRMPWDSNLGPLKMVKSKKSMDCVDDSFVNLIELTLPLRWARSSVRQSSDILDLSILKGPRFESQGILDIRRLYCNCVSTQKGRKPRRCANISQEIVQFKFINSRSCGPSSEMNYKGQRRLLLYEQRGTCQDLVPQQLPPWEPVHQSLRHQWRRTQMDLTHHRWKIRRATANSIN